MRSLNLTIIFAATAFTACTSNEKWETITEFDLEPLHGSYSFDETSGLTVSDASVYRRHATIEGTFTRVAGKSGLALNYSASSSRVAYPANFAAHSKTGKLSILLWLRYTTAATQSMILVSDGFSSFYLNNGSLTYRLVDTIRVNSSNVLSTGQWHQAGVTFDTESVEFFVDGISTGRYSMPQKFSVQGSTGAYISGNAYGVFPSTGLTGEIDEVRIYTSVASQTDIHNHYNQFK